MTHPSLSSDSFSQYQSFHDPPPCQCQFHTLPLLPDSQQLISQQLQAYRTQIHSLELMYSQCHTHLDSLLSSCTQQVDTFGEIKRGLSQLQSQQKGRCRSVTHREAEEEIISGTITCLKTKILLASARIRQVPQSPSLHKMSPQQLDTTVEQPSFIQVDNQHCESPFVSAYKKCILENRGVIFENQTFSVNLNREHEGVRVTLLNKDHKTRLISVDECFPYEEVLIEWGRFQNSKFMANCKVITEGIEIPIPLPLNYIFEERYTQSLSNTLLSQLKRVLTKIHKVRISNVDCDVWARLQLHPECLKLKKQGQKYVGVVSRVGERQLYLLGLSRSQHCLEIVLQSSHDSPFLQDLSEFMIFLLSY